MNYSNECQAGRDHAAHVMRDAAQADNLPALVRAIRDAVKDETGFGAGFLFTVAGAVK